MSGYCPDCGNTLCICDEVAATGVRRHVSADEDTHAIVLELAQRAGCCGDASWRGRLCPYHDGMEAGMDWMCEEPVRPPASAPADRPDTSAHRTRDPRILQQPWWSQFFRTHPTENP